MPLPHSAAAAHRLGLNLRWGQNQGLPLRCFLPALPGQPRFHRGSRRLVALTVQLASPAREGKGESYHALWPKDSWLSKGPRPVLVGSCPRQYGQRAAVEQSAVAFDVICCRYPQKETRQSFLLYLGRR